MFFVYSKDQALALLRAAAQRLRKHNSYLFLRLLLLLLWFLYYLFLLILSLVRSFISDFIQNSGHYLTFETACSMPQ